MVYMNNSMSTMIIPAPATVPTMVELRIGTEPDIAFVALSKVGKMFQFELAQIGFTLTTTTMPIPPESLFHNRNHVNACDKGLYIAFNFHIAPLSLSSIP
jgi:hypothetical protein